MDPGIGAMGVEVCSGPGSYASPFFDTLSSTSPCFSVVLNICPDKTGEGMGRELGAEAAVVPTEVLRFVRGSGLGPCLVPSSEPWAGSLLWEEGALREVTEPEVLASSPGEAGVSFFEGSISGLISGLIPRLGTTSMFSACDSSSITTGCF